MFKTDKGKEVSTKIDSLTDEDIASLKQIRGNATADNTPAPTEVTEVKPSPAPTPSKPLEPSDTDEGPEAVNKTPAEKAKERQAARQPTNLLPVLKEGKGKGYHAYYEGDQYIAKVGARGQLSIIYKDDSGNIDENWNMTIVSHASRQEGATPDKWVVYHFEKMLKFDPPKMDATEVKYTCQRRGDMTTDVVFQFKPEGFTTWSRADETATTPPDMVHSILHHFTGVNKVSKDVDYHKKMKISYDPLDGRKGKSNFYDEKKLVNHVDEYEVSGPLFGKTKMEFKKGKDKNVRLLSYQYPGMTLAYGFTIYTVKDECETTNHDREMLSITFK